MTTDTNPRLALSDAARRLIWEVFGRGADPRNDDSAYQLAVPILSGRLPEPAASSAIAEVRSWFNEDDDEPWVRPELWDPIARIIVQGLDSDFPELAVWAIAAVDADVVAPILREWPGARADAFADASILALSAFQERGHVVDPARASGILGLSRRDARVPRDAVERESPLATFVHLESHGWELVHHALHPCAGNLIDTLVDTLSETNPSRLPSLIARLEHPVLQARAGDRFCIPDHHPDSPHASLSWITAGADDAVIALATINTLHAINNLADRRGGPDGADVGQDMSERKRERSRSLINALVNHGAVLPPERFVSWGADLVAHAPQILHRAPDASCPENVQLLEECCAARLARVVASDRPAKLLAPFRQVTASTTRHAMFRHVADAAWHLRTTHNGQAAAIARLALDDYREYADRELVAEHFYFSWSDWQDRHSIRSLGRALALCVPTLDPAAWISAECQRLPLTIWDGEDRIDAFFAADRIAQHTFLIAIHAIESALDLGRRPTPESVRQMATNIWAHCRLADRVGCLDADITPAAEGAARTAVRLGNPDDPWILSQATAYPGPRALLALVQDRGLESGPTVTQSKSDNVVTAEFAAICRAHFDNRPTPSFGTLACWGKLWLALDAAEPAERTAAAIVDVLDAVGRPNRAAEILILKLLGLAQSRLPIDPDIERQIADRYAALWRPHTPPEELADRAQVDYYRQRATFNTLR